jgi:hypothetical protein
VCVCVCVCVCVFVCTRAVAHTHTHTHMRRCTLTVTLKHVINLTKGPTNRRLTDRAKLAYANTRAHTQICIPMRERVHDNTWNVFSSFFLFRLHIWCDIGGHDAFIIHLVGVRCQTLSLHVNYQIKNRVNQWHVTWNAHRLQHHAIYLVSGISAMRWNL